MADLEMKDSDLLDAERKARAALRGDPPTITPTGDGLRYSLEAGPAVIDYIREVGPPVVLRLVAEIRRLRAEQERLIGRLRNVETWSLEE